MSYITLRYEFGPYQLEPSERVLTRNGEIISLTPKATEILICLLQHAGQLVDKDKLLREVWPDTFVEEANLTQNIFTLRRILGDDRSGPKYIETVTRRGYRFVCPVVLVDPTENPSTRGAVIGLAKPVIAVLPFHNASRDPEMEYLAHGLTDSIVNNLSRISKLHVMSRSVVGRYRSGDIAPRQAGKELGAGSVLVGKIEKRPTCHILSMELVDVTTGWQLWGNTLDLKRKDLLEIQGIIFKQLLIALKLKLTGEEERKVTVRYTENSEAYDSYLEGRYHWSKYTKEGIERAIHLFRQAINLDHNYALAYAAIVDCYLRLSTNYLPPEGDGSILRAVNQDCTKTEDPELVKLRFEWDWKGAERELRRANDLKTDYPTALQWYFAYRACKGLCENVGVSGLQLDGFGDDEKSSETDNAFPAQLASFELTSAEQLQVYCAIVREQIDAGNYEACCRILQPWWSFGNRPRLDGLNSQACADLLFTTGELAGFVASSVHMHRGQKHAEELLHGSVALFEQLGFVKRVTEARIALALCYHRQGLYDMGRFTLTRVLDDLSEEDWELRCLAFMRLGGLERAAGRLQDALSRLIQATQIDQKCGPWITARCHLELASIHKDLAIAEDVPFHFERATHFYLRALHQFKAVGHHRYVAVVENNMGLLSLALRAYDESELHLLRAARLFSAFGDRLRGAQVDDNLARLYLEIGHYERAHSVINRAIGVFELADGEAILSEALRTKGVVASKLGRFSDCKSSLEASYQISERCSDGEGAGLALLIMFEEIGDQLERAEKVSIVAKLKDLLATTQQTLLKMRVEKAIAEVGSNSLQVE
jgi:DNA-binding winged helix-turn-helix (wHTH) protein/tetratricopeptide (TPR) repeat protein